MILQTNVALSRKLYETDKTVTTDYDHTTIKGL